VIKKVKREIKRKEKKKIKREKRGGKRGKKKAVKRVVKREVKRETIIITVLSFTATSIIQLRASILADIERQCIIKQRKKKYNIARLRVFSLQ
jgi:hypothetical protein